MVVEGANNGGLLSKINGLSLFVPVSQLEKKGDKEWWTEQVRGWAPCSPVWLPFYLPGCPGTPLQAGWRLLASAYPLPNGWLAGWLAGVAVVCCGPIAPPAAYSP